MVTDGRSHRNRYNLRSDTRIRALCPAAKFERITLPRTNYFTVTAPRIGNWERANFSSERSRDKFARIVNEMRPKCSENRILEIDANPARALRSPARTLTLIWMR